MDYHLNEVDPEDVSDTLVKLQRSLGFTFSHDELAKVTTYGELSHLVHAKLQDRHINDCSTQQAFYKARQAIINITSVTAPLTPASRMETIFPKKGRRRTIRLLHRNLGFKPHILTPPVWLTNALGIAALLSIIALFIDWRYGLSTLIISIIGSCLAERFGKNFDTLTLGELANVMVRDHYMEARRYPGTLNRSEIGMVIKQLFTETLFLDPAALTPEARF